MRVLRSVHPRRSRASPGSSSSTHQPPVLHSPALLAERGARRRGAARRPSRLQPSPLSPRERARVRVLPSVHPRRSRGLPASASSATTLLALSPPKSICYAANRNLWGCSSIGRASDWQSEGRGFESPQLHQFSLLARRRRCMIRQERAGRDRPFEVGLKHRPARPLHRRRLRRSGPQLRQLPRRHPLLHPGSPRPASTSPSR